MGRNTVVLAAAILLLAQAAVAEDFERKRAGMVRAIEMDVAETSSWIEKTSLNPDVMKVMGQTPRHLFVPGKLIRFAYENRPLPIGHGQTISQPYIVALMTDLAGVDENSVALEVGTGSGYQAAVLSRLAGKVYTVEIIKPLAASAQKKFKTLDYKNISAKTGDGYYGWPGAGPFDAIIVTAAASHIPPPLVKQLKPGGRMIIPVGSRFMVQQLTIVDKGADGTVTTRQVLPVMFVPLTGKR